MRASRARMSAGLRTHPFSSSSPPARLNPANPPTHSAPAARPPAQTQPTRPSRSRSPVASSDPTHPPIPQPRSPRCPACSPRCHPVRPSRTAENRRGIRDERLQETRAPAGHDDNDGSAGAGKRAHKVVLALRQCQVCIAAPHSSAAPEDRRTLGGVCGGYSAFPSEDVVPSMSPSRSA